MCDNILNLLTTTVKKLENVSNQRSPFRGFNVNNGIIVSIAPAASLEYQCSLKHFKCCDYCNGVKPQSVHSKIPQVGFRHVTREMVILKGS